MLSLSHTDLVWMVVDKEQFNSLLYFSKEEGHKKSYLYWSPELAFSIYFSPRHQTMDNGRGEKIELPLKLSD